MTDYRLWPSTNGPGSSAADAAISLGTQFAVTAPCYLADIHIWLADSAAVAAGPFNARVYRLDTTAAVPGTDVTFAPTTPGWQTAAVSPRVTLSPGINYRVAAYFPSRYSTTPAYWATGPGVGGITQGFLVAPDAGSAAQGAYAYGSPLQLPTLFFGGANYWVDITVSDVADPGGPPPPTPPAVVQFGDAEAAVADIVRAGVTGATVATTLVGYTEGASWIVVSRSGGVPTLWMRLDAPTIQVDVYAADKGTAHDLAQLARGLVFAAAGAYSGHGLYLADCRDFTGLAWLPDPDTTLPRYVFQLSLTTRPTD